jgi:hypothetical protein
MFPLVLLQAKAVSSIIPWQRGIIETFPLVLLQAKAVSFFEENIMGIKKELMFPLVLLQAKAVRME